MSALAGLWPLVRFVLRRERIALPVWILLLTLYVVGTAAGIAGLYTTPEARAAFAAAINHTPAELALLGPVFAPDLGGLLAWRVGTAGALLLSVMGLLTVTRHTRAEEDSGRRELLASAPVGRLAPLTAALLVTLGANLAFALLSALGLAALGLPFGGALLLGLALAGCGWVFAGLSALAVQLASSARAAGTLVGAALGLAWGLRMVADGAGIRWLGWLSPLGWLGEARAFAENRWWALLLPLAASLLLGWLALSWQARRDLGAALLPARPGPAAASPGLATPLALAWRLQRGLLLSWLLGYLALGLLMGWLAQAGGAQLASSGQFGGLMGGASPGDALFTLGLMLMGGEMLAVYALLAALRPRSEELAGLADPVLAAPVSRLRWLGPHLLIALAGSALVLAAFGLGAGLTYGLSLGDVAGQLPRLLGAALVYAPAAWLLSGIACAFTGLAPRLSALSWGPLALFLAIDLLAEVQRAGALRNLSPFMQIPKVLLGPWSGAGLGWLCAVAALLLAAGLLGWRRRDLA